ncbi:hypothetical protein BU23DRAFT_554965 [Bimuria novae-zelandiae CBS 107.79]|uniref:Uncharacterized protein n=1 Tax=Bimuria novae-zelandiae CBS 107.79 TaxID=1447943 RepID=A0A6A5V6F7_9PLEO|nr:hypothetical protein BU23DRAFT_554965 [Bimuria novae-zelandiae CBS 107.79]
MQNTASRSYYHKDNDPSGRHSRIHHTYSTAGRSILEVQGWGWPNMIYHPARLPRSFLPTGRTLIWLRGNDGIWLSHERFKVCDFKKCVRQKVRTTIISTPCYTGGWKVRKDLNMTFFAAAGPHEGKPILDRQLIR